MLIFYWNFSIPDVLIENKHVKGGGQGAGQGFYSRPPHLTLFRAASDPTYLERVGEDSSPHQFSPHRASNGLLMIPSKTFDVYGTNKKMFLSGVRNWGLGPNFKIAIKCLI